MDDLTATRLVLKSLDQPLDVAEKIALEAHLAHSEQSRQFANLLHQIQSVVVKFREIESELESGPGLSDVAFARLQRQVDQSLLRIESFQASDSNGDSNTASDRETGLGSGRKVAESEDDYRGDRPSSTD